MTCAACKHVATKEIEPPFGVCRRFPPTALSTTQSQFPIIHLENFTCGEFAARTKTATPAPSKAGIKRKK